MQYQTPQFIEIEDKIFGPLTFKQFLYLAGGGGVCLLLFTLLPSWLAFVLASPVVALALALAFYEINGRPFIMAMEHAFHYQFGSKLYLWRQRQAEEKPAAAAKQVIPTEGGVPKLSQSKLRDLSWSLNIKDQQKFDPAQGVSSSFQI